MELCRKKRRSDMLSATLQCRSSNFLPLRDEASQAPQRAPPNTFGNQPTPNPKTKKPLRVSREACSDLVDPGGRKVTTI